MTGMIEAVSTTTNATPWIALLLSSLLKGTLVLTAAALLAYTLRRSAAALRYIVWSVGLLSLLAIPMLSLVLPVWKVPVWPQALSVLPEASEAQHVAPPSFEEAGPEDARVTFTDSPASAPKAAQASPRVATPAPEAAETLPAESTPAVSVGEQILLPLVRTFQSVLGRFEFHWTTWLLVLWLGGLSCILVRLAVAHVGVYAAVRGAEPVEEDAWHLEAERIARRLGIKELVRLRWSRWSVVPMNAGILRPVVLLPEEASTWDDEHREAVLLHELAHVKRRDCLVQLLANITCALHWFNPMVWVAAWRLRVERERACDDMVLIAGAKASKYAQTILETVGSLRSVEWSPQASMAMARRSQLEGRLLAILDAGNPRRHTSRASAGLATMLLTCIVLPLAAMRPAIGEEPENLRNTADRLLAPADTDHVASSRPSDELRQNVDLGIHAPLVTDVDIEAVPGIGYDPDLDLQVYFDFDHVFEAIDQALDITIGLGLDDMNEVALEFTSELELDQSWGSTTLGDSVSVEQLIQLRKNGVDAEFVRELRELGYDQLTVRELITLSRYDASPAYIRSMQEAGFDDLTVEQLIRMRKYDLDAELVRALRQQDYADLTPDQLVTLSKYDVDPEDISALDRLGYSNLSVEDLVSMSKYDIEPGVIEAMQRLGYLDLSVNELIELSKYDIEPESIATLNELGYADLSVEELIALSKYDVDASYVREIRQAGAENVSIEQLIEMRKHGVDGEFVRSIRENND